MRRGKFLGILLMLTVPLMATGRIVGGQAYNTQTVTTPVTNSQVSTITVGTSVATSTVPLAQVIFSSPFTLPPTHGVCGIYFDQPFNATTGQSVVGNLTASSKVDFYILTNKAYQAWSHQIVAGGNCTAGNAVLSQKDTILYNFTNTIPANGTYQIVVNNLTNSTVNAHLTVNLITSSLSMTTIVIYSTLTQPSVETLTLITLATAQAQGSPVDTFTIIIGVLVVVIIIATIALRVRRKRGSKSDTE